MINNKDRIKQLLYDILNAVEKVSYDTDNERLKKVLIEYEVIKDEGGQ